MRKLLHLLSAAVVIALSVTSCTPVDNPVSPVTPPEPVVKADTARHTIIMYGVVGGASDPQIETAWEIMKPYLNDRKNVRCVVCYKYAKPEHFAGKYAKPGDLVLFELTDTTDLMKIGENYAVKWPDLALYEESTLTSIIDLASTVAPAREYTFLTYGHGGGFDKNVDYEKDQRKAQPNSNRAVLYDEWIETPAGQEAMNMYEFLRGINNSKVPHFKSIFFHNCLMGGVESVFDISLFCDYLVVSSHLLAMNPAPIRQFIKATTEQKDLKTAYLQMLSSLSPEWDKGYQGYGFNGDLKLIDCQKLLDVIDPAAKLTNRLKEIYPTQSEMLDTAMVHTYQYYNEKNFYDLEDYAAQVAKYTGDSQLKTISAQLSEALGKAILGRAEMHFSTLGDLPKFTLSVVLCSNKDYQAKTAWDYTFKEAYEYTNWHIFTGFGDWLNTTRQGPRDQSEGYQGQPVGQCFSQRP